MVVTYDGMGGLAGWLLSYPFSFFPFFLFFPLGEDGKGKTWGGDESPALVSGEMEKSRVIGEGWLGYGSFSFFFFCVLCFEEGELEPAG